MTMRKPLFDQEVLELIPWWVEQGATMKEIAEWVGCQVNTLQVMCSRHRISLRKGGYRAQINLSIKPREPISLPESIARLVTRAADKLNRKPEQLISDLLEKITADNLFAAVLDEEGCS
jgi:hypothetical protein